MTSRRLLCVLVFSCLLPSPAVGLESTLHPTTDTFLNHWEGFPCGTPSVNLGLSYIGVKEDRRDRESKGLLFFDLSTIPPGSIVLQATLRLYATSESEYLTTNFTVSRVIENWSPSEATWCNRTNSQLWCLPGGCGTVAGQATTLVPSHFHGGSGAYNQWVEWDVTALTRDWIEAGQPNWGLLVAQVPLPSTIGNQEFQFASTEHPQANLYAPQLLISTGLTSDALPDSVDNSAWHAENDNCGMALNHDADPVLTIKDSMWDRVSRALIRFQFPTLQPNTPLVAAKLRLYFVGSSEYTTNDITVAPIAEEWRSSEVNWCNRAVGTPWCSDGVCFEQTGVHSTIQVPAQFPRWNEWDVTDIVRLWWDGVQPNYGFGVYARHLDDGGGGNRELYFATREYPDALLRPQLFVYTDNNRVAVLDPSPVEEELLSPSIPNPSSRATTIPYTLTSRETIKVAVFDIFGRLVNVLMQSEQNPGRHIAIWDGIDSAGSRVPPGVYFVRIEAGNLSDQIKVIRVR